MVSRWAHNSKVGGSKPLSAIFLHNIMFDYLRELTYADKILENSVLGKISCGAFNDTLSDCKQHNRKYRGLDPCT